MVHYISIHELIVIHVSKRNSLNLLTGLWWKNSNIRVKNNKNLTISNTAGTCNMMPTSHSTGITSLALRVVQIVFTFIGKQIAKNLK